MDRIAYARAAFAEMADAKLVAVVDRLLADRTAEWVVDPEVPGTFALCQTGERREALVLVYAPGAHSPTRWDFEHGDQIDRLLP